MSSSDHSHSTFETLIAIVLSYIFASSLNVYPLSSSLAILRPMIMIMVLVFWLIFKPRYTGLFTAFTIGLIADLILDTRLGQQAFAAVIMALVVKVASIYIKQLSMLSAWFLACLCLLIFQSVLWILQFITQDLFLPEFGGALLMSMVCWPFVLLVLRRYSR